MGNIPDLTPAEYERLALLAEECGEVVQVIGKILRHGYESHSPLDPLRVPNRSLLQKECGDVLHVIDRMIDRGDIRKAEVERHRDNKAGTVVRYLHHQDRS